MFELEKEMIAIYDKMGDCTPEEMDILMEDVKIFSKKFTFWLKCYV